MKKQSILLATAIFERVKNEQFTFCMVLYGR